MAGVAMNIIGLGLRGLGLIPLFTSFAPDRTDQTTTVRIGVGTSLDSSVETKGDTPGIALFDVAGRRIGENKGNHKNIGDGSFKDLTITADSDVGGRQAEYISISKGGNDALCIAYLTVTWPDNSKYIWSADVGFSCGANWYASQTTFGAANDGYKPRCMWIDGDNSNGITTQGFGLHITDFVATKERATAFAQDNDIMCKSPPRFTMYNQITSDDSLPYFDPPLEYEPGTLLDKDRSKVLVPGSNRDDKHKPSRRRLRYRQAPNGRSAPTGTAPPFPISTGTALRSSAMAGRLITSNDKSTSAIELCGSETSLGPDHVSFAERKFCDMDTKQLWPLCDGPNDTAACFDTTTYAMRAGTGSTSRVDRRDGSGTPPSVPVKGYHTVDNWN